MWRSDLQGGLLSLETYPTSAYLGVTKDVPLVNDTLEAHALHSEKERSFEGTLALLGRFEEMTTNAAPEALVEAIEEAARSSATEEAMVFERTAAGNWVMNAADGHASSGAPSPAPQDAAPADPSPAPRGAARAAPSPAPPDADPAPQTPTQPSVPSASSSCVMTIKEPEERRPSFGVGDQWQRRSQRMGSPRQRPRLLGPKAAPKPHLPPGPSGCATASVQAAAGRPTAGVGGRR